MWKKFSKWQPCFDAIDNEFDSAVKLSVTKQGYTNNLSMYRKVDKKLRYVYIITYSCAGKLIKSCGMYISPRVRVQES